MSKKHAGNLPLALQSIGLVRMLDFDGVIVNRSSLIHAMWHKDRDVTNVAKLCGAKAFNNAPLYCKIPLDSAQAVG